MKKNFYVLFLLSVISCSNNKLSLESEMTRLNVNTAMIVRSQAIDEYPLWSEDSKFIGVNIMDRWVKLDLQNIKLSVAGWRNQDIGLITNENNISDLTNKELEQFNLCSKNGIRKVITKTGKEIELKLNGFSTSLIITEIKAQPTTLWTSGMENCHSLSLSPDEKYVAYICELNGLLVMKL